ncbi:hypothetical protein CALCODRAFT_515143 [Calocera cornea HHB12733]|uniref:CoA-dependent acyltransferase n=1 Tax=Calocera cornea HHB12733 TaxID=1353952 RepID=A0A165IM68_9BASI|nr:hypothetical protein CALCODRAFT_515143 [Calocera cornea HHB12733]
MATSDFHPHDFTRYQWHLSPTDPKTYQRETSGIEVLMDFGTRFNHGQFTLFLGLELDFKTSISATEFEHLAREAWIALRFQVPMIAARTPVNADNRAIFTYRSPDSFAEVEDWATRTVRVGRDCDSVDTLRHEVGNQYTPDPDGDQVFLYVASNNGRPSGLLLQSSHMIFDGMGSKALMHIYLRHMLTPLLSGESKADIATLTWGNEVETLLPCVSEVLAHNEPRVGSEYDKTLQEVLKGFASYMPKMYPFKVRAAPGPGPRVHMQRFFTTQESAQIRAAVRTHGFTVSQLFHAALNLVVAIDNPPTNETAADAAFVYYGIVNSRPDRLRAPYSGREGYPGNCLGLSALSFPLDTLRGRVDFFDRSLLLAMTEQVKEAYEVQKQYPALLAVQSHVFDIMLSPFFAGAPLPPPLGGPYFIGDGITENYIDHEYKDNSGKSSVSVRSVFISANLTDPAAFRVCSWRDRLQADVDFNEHVVPLEAGNAWMDNWVKLVKLILL